RVRSWRPTAPCATSTGSALRCATGRASWSLSGWRRSAANSSARTALWPSSTRPDVRRITLQVPVAQLDEAYDALLPRLPGGLHVREHDGDVELVAIGDDGELPPVAEVRGWVGHLARGA